MHSVLCPVCGDLMRRSRRTFIERLLYNSAYRCEDCQLRVKRSRIKSLINMRYVACPRCGRFELKILARRDGIDTMNQNPLRLILGQLKARLYHCRACRLQFYDVRRRMPLHDRRPQLDSSDPRALAR